MAKISDLIVANEAAHSVLNGVITALASAQSSLSAAQADAASKDAALGAGLAVLHTDVFVLNPNGSATLYSPDGKGGFITYAALPADTELPDPTPVPPVDGGEPPAVG